MLLYGTQLTNGQKQIIAGGNLVVIWQPLPMSARRARNHHFIDNLSRWQGGRR